METNSAADQAKVDKMIALSKSLVETMQQRLIEARAVSNIRLDFTHLYIAMKKFNSFNHFLSFFFKYKKK